MDNEKPPKRDYVRFERTAPNELWQMDFKGHFGLTNGTQCHSFGVVDDHSRYSISLAACGDERTATVKGHLTQAFGLYGLPEAMLWGNGSRWTDGRSQAWTSLSVWLCDLGIRVIHTAPYHPQTNGKRNACTSRWTSKCSAPDRHGTTWVRSKKRSTSGNRSITISVLTNRWVKPSFPPTGTPRRLGLSQIRSRIRFIHPTG